MKAKKTLSNKEKRLIKKLAKIAGCTVDEVIRAMVLDGELEPGYVWTEPPPAEDEEEEE